MLPQKAQEATGEEIASFPGPVYEGGEGLNWYTLLVHVLISTATRHGGYTGTYTIIFCTPQLSEARGTCASGVYQALSSLAPYGLDWNKVN